MKQEDVLSAALQLLRKADVHISGGNLSNLSLTLPGGSTLLVNVRVSSVPPTPSMVAGYLQRQDRQLVITRRSNRNAANAAEKDALDLVTVEPASVIIGGRELLDSGESNTATHSPSRGKHAWGRYALARSLLLSHQPLIQRELADCAGISQPAVTKNLRWLRDWVARTDDGWLATDKTALLSFLVSHYPGTHGAVSHWYSLDPLSEQVREAINYAREMGAQPLVSGDAAADIYAPWRRPHRATLYLREFVDFSDARFSPASRDEATLTTVTPEDQTLWMTAPEAEHEDLPLADPLITLWDISLDEAPDTPDAVKHLREVILSGVIS